MARTIDLTGQRFGRLIVLERVGTSKSGRIKWLCQCDCGKSATTTGTNLRTGVTKSCGCYMIECETTRIKEICTTHGKSHTRLYRTWKNMKQRCYNPNNTYYHRYGGRGITICAEWKQDFKAFYDWAMSNGYTDELTIDRIDVNGNYEPSNCRWVTKEIQNKNTRRNINITYKGETHNVREWSSILNININTLYDRLRRGWSGEKTLSTPIKHQVRTLFEEG